ncbi:MAG: prepilin peptidase [Patescibacteria group bacterium]
MSLAIVLTFVGGLAFGSFLGLTTFRLPRGRAYLTGRSFCPNCGTKIAWYDNIPIVSFLLLKGRCRHCHKKISWRYPLIELATATTFLAIYLKFGLDIPLLIVSLLTITVFVIDLEKRIIPDEIVFFGYLITLAFLVFGPFPAFYSYLFAGFFSSFFLLTVHLLTKGRGMGLGDVKYALFVGTFLGWPYSLVWLFLAFLTGAALGSILVLLRKAKFGRQIAFGPFLAAAFFISLFLAENLLRWFLT